MGKPRGRTSPLLPNTPSEYENTLYTIGDADYHLIPKSLS